LKIKTKKQKKQQKKQQLETGNVKTKLKIL
jgi:hypothetical protein